MRRWCIPPERNADFVKRLEEVLDVYQLPYDPAYPVICFDECSKELQTHLVEPQVSATGTHIDTEYARHGMAPLHVWIEPHTGRMGVAVTERRTKGEFAQAMRALAAHYPAAQQLTVVLDNLNTHQLSACYEVFPPEEARQLRRRIRLVNTPKHGSWLNMAELAISVLSRAVLQGQRIPTRDALEQAVTAWVARHNADPHPINWTWDVDQARLRMPRLYPIIEEDKEA